MQSSNIIATVGDHMPQGALAEVKRALKKKKTVVLIPVSTGIKQLPVDNGGHIKMPVLRFDLGGGVQGILPAVETDIMLWTLPDAPQNGASDAAPAPADKAPATVPDNKIPVFPGKEYATENIPWTETTETEEGQTTLASLESAPETVSPDSPAEPVAVPDNAAPPAVPRRRDYVVKASVAARWRSLSEHNQRWVKSRMVEMLGIPLEMRVLAIDDNHAYLSRWEFIAETAFKTLAELAVGQTHPVTVVDIFRTGAHCRLGGFPVLLPITEVAHTFVNDITDYLCKGSTYMARVIKIDRAVGLVTVSTRVLAPDPWKNVFDYHQPGTHAVGVATRLEEDGSRYRIRLQSGFTANAPVPAFQSVPIGGTVVLHIVSINPARRFIDGRIKNVVAG